MDIVHIVKSHLVQIGLGWLLVQNFLKALQDAIDAEPKGLQPIARIVYYMQAIGGYVFAGNRIQPIQKITAVLAIFLALSVGAMAQTTGSPSVIDETYSIASDVSSVLNPTAGIMYGVREHQVKYVSSFQAFGYQNTQHPLIRINANLLYSPSDMLGGSITYPLGSFSSITGLKVSTPILNWLANANLNVGWGLGWFTSGGSRSNDDGPIVSGNIKF